MSDDRHLPRLATMVDNLGSAIAGRTASQILDAGAAAEQPANGVLVVLPSWVWIVPKINVGRKGVSRDGEQLTMPVRVSYDDSPVRILTSDAEVNASGRLIGLGYDNPFCTPVRPLGDYGVHPVQIAGEEMSPEVRHFASHRMLERALRAVVKAGEAARWEVISSLEVFTRIKLAAANTVVAAEIGEHNNRALMSVVDEITLEELLSKLLYGEAGSSVISRMVDRAMDPETFRRVDPMRYFAVAIRARAEEAIRQAIGDPKVGPKVRRIQAMSNAQSIDELLDAYRTVYPQDSLAAKRAIAALTAGPVVAAYQREFNDQRGYAPPATESDDSTDLQAIA